MLTVLATLGGVALLAGVGFFAGKLAHRGYRFLQAVCAAGAVLLGGLWALDRASWWADAWVMVPATAAALLVPLAAVLVGYYTRGSSPRFVPDLAALLVAGAAIIALSGWQPWETTGDALAAAAITLAGLLVLVPAAGQVRRSPTYGGRYRRALIIGGLALAAVGAWQAWDRWPVQAELVALGVVVAILVLAFAGVLVVSGAWWPLLRRDFRDPTERADAILTLVHERLGLAPLPRNVEDGAIDGRARRLVDVLAPAGGNRLLDRLISEAADRNAAPFFKQFLRVVARDGVLRIECWG